MYLSSKLLKRILLGLVALAIILGLVATYLYFPTLMNRFGFNKTPSKEVQQLLTGYNTTQTPEGYLELDKEVAKMAVSSPSLDVTNCTPYPRIIKVDIGKTLKVINSDPKMHTLIIQGLTIKIEPRETREIVLDFVKTTPEVVTYVCDNPNSFAGILYATGIF